MVGGERLSSRRKISEPNDITLYKKKVVHPMILVEPPVLAYKDPIGEVDMTLYLTYKPTRSLMLRI